MVAVKSAKEKEKNEGKINETLSKIYFDPSNPSAFGGVRRLYLACRKNAMNISLDAVKKWLSEQPCYSQYRRVVGRFQHKKVLVPKINHQWQADLADFSRFSSQNDGYKFVLCTIDCFSRFVRIRCTKDKKSSTIANAFQSILREARVSPEHLQTDKGSEFYGAPFRDVLHKYKIRLFSPSQDVKAQIVERFNRTLKEKIMKYCKLHDTDRYIDVIDAIVHGYNSCVHSALKKFAPSEVTADNQDIVRKLQYSRYLNQKKKKFKFQRGDRVRLSKYRETFRRTRHHTFTTEIFTIFSQIKSHNETNKTIVPTYRVADVSGDVVASVFYEDELQKIG